MTLYRCRPIPLAEEILLDLPIKRGQVGDMIVVRLTRPLAMPDLARIRDQLRDALGPRVLVIDDGIEFIELEPLEAVAVAPAGSAVTV